MTYGKGLVLVVSGGFALIAVGWMLASAGVPGAQLVTDPIAVLGTALGTMAWKRRIQRRFAAAKNR
ncbi:MAG: hypothetical protein JWN36_840 [Microbacteriaceae bacterium]|nr:hypothetical protein [Microbacteriaceae bacterium]